MIILIYGQDKYRSRQKLNEIVEYYKKIHKSGLNLRYFEGGGLNFKDFQDQISQVAMFKEKKLIILKDVFSNQGFKEEFINNFKKIINSGEIFLFYETGEILKNDKFFQLLKKYGKSQEFKLLEGKKLIGWVKKEVESYGVKIDFKAIEMLINFVGADTWQLSNEIKKIVSYKKTNKYIQIKDIKLLVRPKIEADIFKTIDAIATKDKSKALILLKRHIEKGDPPLYLLKMINFQLRNLLMVKIYEGEQKFKNIKKLSQKLALQPFVFKKTIQQARKFSFEELKKIYQKIFEIDYNIKTGKIEPEIALDLLIAEI